MPGMFFEDFKEGMVLESPGRTITIVDIVNFAGVSGDFNPIHVDEEYARKTLFGRRIAHGVLTLAVMTGLWDSMGFLRGTVIAFYGIDKLRFTKPVYPGDTVKVRITVVEKKEKEKGGVVTLRNEVLNQNGEVVLVCDAKLLMKKKS